MEPISKRIYDFLFIHKGYKNDTIVAKELGYSHPEKISRLFREGKAAKPSVDILEDITNKFGSELSIEWVLTGKGNMIKEEAFTLNDPGEHEYKKSGSSPDSLARVLNNEILRMRSSLDTLSQVASGVLQLQPISNGEAQDLPWGKSGDSKKKKDKNNH
jgi:hypothetical protein